MKILIATCAASLVIATFFQQSAGGAPFDPPETEDAIVPGQPAAPTFQDKVRTQLGLDECLLYGRRFWRVPNTPTCIRLHAQVTADGFVHSPSSPTDTVFRPQVIGGLETRSATSFGTFRTFVTGRWVEDVTRSGSLARSSSSTAPTTGTTEPDPETAQLRSNGSGLDQAFVEYLGFTVGRTYSFFDFENGYTLAGARVSLRRADLAAYTGYFFGDSLALSISVERNRDRQTFISGDPTVDYDKGNPDIVGAARYLLPNMRLQASVASHAIDVTNPAYAGATGFAAQVGASIFFPDISSPFADRLSVSAAYAEGAASYLGFATSAPDAVALGNSLFLTQGWNVSGSYLHFWSEHWSSAVTTGYATLSSGLSSPNFSSLDEWRTAVNLVWRPLPDWQFGVEYQHVEQETVSDTKTRSRSERGQVRARYNF